MKKIHFHIRLASIVFLVVIFAGTFAYHHFEGWSMLDSLYFVVVTITTIGFGDFSPHTEIGKIFTIFFSFFGIAIAFYWVSIIGSAVFKRHVGQQILEIKEDIQKEKEVKEKRKKLNKSLKQ